MPYYSRALQTPAAAAGAPYLQLLPQSSLVMAVHEIGIVLEAATASEVALILSATLGTASTTLQGVNEAGLQVNSTCLLASAWSAAPTIAGSPARIRYVSLPATAGTQLTWVWPEASPLLINGGISTDSLLLWNTGSGAGSALSAYVRWSEASRIVAGKRYLVSNTLTAQNDV